MSAQRKHHLFTEAEYRQYEDVSITKHEYFRGEIFAMAGASMSHNLISGNIHASLHSQLRGRSCRPFASDQRIKVERNGLHTYPDVAVICQPFVCDPHSAITLMDALVIIEVLCPSTAYYDRIDKLDLYRELLSLRHYILVAQDEINVEHRFLNAQDEWQTEIFTSLEDTIRLEAIDCVLKVSEIYEDIENLG